MTHRLKRHPAPTPIRVILGGQGAFEVEKCLKPFKKNIKRNFTKALNVTTGIWEVGQDHTHPHSAAVMPGCLPRQPAKYGSLQTN